MIEKKNQPEQEDNWKWAKDYLFSIAKLILFSVFSIALIGVILIILSTGD